MPTDRTQDRKVVNMTQFASSARFQPIKEVEAYWQAIRAGRLVPRRSDIDPRGIERARRARDIVRRHVRRGARVREAPACAEEARCDSSSDVFERRRRGRGDARARGR